MSKINQAHHQKPAIPDDTKARQQAASNPYQSAWVSANAGSGKTYVLSRRVIRLLLAGYDPGCILCITFTKAAATEMANRVFEELAKWTRVDDHALKEDLKDIGETDVCAKRIRAARCLFASALETPGGLKVQTIHAFCERLLQQFPFEANVPGHFEIADDTTTVILLNEARQHVLRDAIESPDSELGRAYRALIDQTSDDQIDAAITALLVKRNQFQNSIQTDTAEATKCLREALDLPPNTTLETIGDDVGSGNVGGFGINALHVLKNALEYHPTNNHEKLLSRINDALNVRSSSAEFVIRWLDIFLTTTGARSSRKSKSFVSSAFQTAYPALFDQICATLENDAPKVLNLVNSQITLERTQNLLILGRAMLDFYEKAKTKRALLDYDDLIGKTVRLLSRSEAANWVQYKLDRGLSHVLVDEAQDTSPEQWEIIQALTDAFFEEERHHLPNGHLGTRTLFAVGDEKQSIFSFQGAAPGIFEEKRRMLGQKAKRAQLGFDAVNLNLSFRSTDHVLSAVDAVFENPELAQSIATLGVEPHQAYRAKTHGFVEIWPVVEAETTQLPETDWRLPVDTPSPAIKLLADRIAHDIATRVKEGTQQPSDILILLKKRSNIMGLISTALKKTGVPVAGMDRLRLNSHIAVQDLICLGEVLLLPQNDLALATLLKSPLFGYLDQDLERIAINREGSLLKALYASSHPHDSDTSKTLKTWLKRVDYEEPYRLFARLLNEDGMRAKLLTRLGQEAADMIEAFLDEAIKYQNSGDDLGLEGFIHWMRNRNDDLKRQMDAPRGEVRIMTAHGAKGLEAKCVYLVDDGSAPTHNSQLPTLLSDSKTMGFPIIIWPALNKASQPQMVIELFNKAKQEALDEYRRLLYVAMTRAEDILILCACATDTGLHPDNWYNAVCSGLRVKKTSEKWIWTKNWSGPESSWYRNPQNKADPIEQSQVDQMTAMPDWIHRPPPQVPYEGRSITPSKLSFDADEDDDILWSEPLGATNELTNSHLMLRGSLIHGLLAYMPNCPLDMRNKMAKAWLKQTMPPDVPGRLSQDILMTVNRVVNDQALSFLFTNEARAEVTIAGRIKAGNEFLSISGRADRLVHTERGILIVDFKTSRQIPEGPNQAPLNYINQMAAYRAILQSAMPGKAIQAALVWTEAPRLDLLDEDKLNAAQERLLSRS